jgi:mono/diheme cytochrome c family protein
MGKYCFSLKPLCLLPGVFTAFFLLPILHADAQTKPWPVPGNIKELKNPEASNSNSVKDGKALYTSLCAPCHGDKGKGDGPAAAALNPKPADHSSPAMMNESDGSIFYKITEGRNPMPQFKATLSDSQRWALVCYIRTLCKAPKKS